MNKVMTGLLLAFSLVLFGCETNDGSAEKVGEKMDKAYTDSANAVEDACEDVKEGVNAEDTDC